MTQSKSARRCAVYTRKSTEEGLDQAFNSLDAQREACEAYIKSQAHEGWSLVKTKYDDGGYSGGSMDRPALRQLLADISAHKIDVIVVYKVDRLTRSLADFAKIVETLDAQTASFVSVTQAFNTTTSMGRLTLNVLLSFAQFEREITGERIRDKIAASKRKGLWMGGVPPLGYDVKDRKLVVNDLEVETARKIFLRYLELGSVPMLAQELERNGIRSKTWTTGSGRKAGGAIIRRGALYCILRNRTYVGEIGHKGNIYPGEHPAIVGRSTWDQVQTKLDGNRPCPIAGMRVRGSALLTGLLYDNRGNRMSPTFAKKKNGRRYRYYTSRALIEHRKDEAGSVTRVSAPFIEALVLKHVVVQANSPSAPAGDLLVEQNHATIVASRVARVDLASDSVSIKVRRNSETGCSVTSDEGTKNDAGDRVTDDTLLIQVPLRQRAYRGAGSIASSNCGDDNVAPRPNLGLVRAIVRGWGWRNRIETGKAVSIEALARHECCTRSYVRSMLALSFLAPKLVELILGGKQPKNFTVRGLLELGVPASWQTQRQLFGID